MGRIPGVVCILAVTIATGAISPSIHGQCLLRPVSQQQLGVGLLNRSEFAESGTRAEPKQLTPSGEGTPATADDGSDVTAKPETGAKSGAVKLHRPEAKERLARGKPIHFGWHSKAGNNWELRIHAAPGRTQDEPLRILKGLSFKSAVLPPEDGLPCGEYVWYLLDTGSGARISDVLPFAIVEAGQQPVPLFTPPPHAKVLTARNMVFEWQDQPVTFGWMLFIYEGTQVVDDFPLRVYEDIFKPSFTIPATEALKPGEYVWYVVGNRQLGYSNSDERRLTVLHSGDYNADRSVDLADLLAFHVDWHSNLGLRAEAAPKGDYNDDRVVDMSDLIAFNADWQPNASIVCP